jgi:hypothetical protein
MLNLSLEFSMKKKIKNRKKKEKDGKKKLLFAFCEETNVNVFCSSFFF